MILVVAPEVKLGTATPEFVSYFPYIFTMAQTIIITIQPWHPIKHSSVAEGEVSQLQVVQPVGEALHAIVPTQEQLQTSFLHILGASLAE